MTNTPTGCSSSFTKLERITATLVRGKGTEAGKIVILIDKENAVVSCIDEFVLFSPHLVLRV